MLTWCGWRVQELLEFVAHYHCLLDLINLVTCLYRLAKMSKEASRGRSGYLAELQRNPTFQLLLRELLYMETSNTAYVLLCHQAPYKVRKPVQLH